MSEKRLPTGDAEPQIISKPEARDVLTRKDDQPIPNPAVDLRVGYLIKRRAIIDTSLDEGEKLHGLGTVKRGQSPSHFVFRADTPPHKRHDIHVDWDPDKAETIWDALLCSCPTGRHRGDPCWHKGAVRAFLANNQHIRYANALLALPLA